MLFLDSPDHTRLRNFVNRAFTRRTVTGLEPHIRAHTTALLDAIGDLAGFDLTEAVATPLPVIVIAEMLGVPPEDRARFKAWSAQRARLLEPTLGAGEREVAARAAQSFDEYFLQIIEARRAEPRDDIISALAQAEEAGDRLTEREMLTLLRHPDQLQALRDDPGLIPAAVEELLRFDSPVQTDFRDAARDREVNGLPGEAGPEHRIAARRGESRSGGVRAAGPPRHHAQPAEPRGVRPRHPPLPRGAAGSPGGPHRHRDAARALRLDAPAHRSPDIPQQRRAARPRIAPGRGHAHLTIAD